MEVKLWKVFKVGDAVLLLNVLWGSSVDDDDDADAIIGCFDWVEVKYGNLKVSFPIPRGEEISDDEKEKIFQVILEALKRTPKRHFIEGDIMEEYELPESAGSLSSYFKKFINQPRLQYWW